MATTPGYPQVINTGTTPGDGTGDSSYTAFSKVNANFADVYAELGAAQAATATLGQNVSNQAQLNSQAITQQIGQLSTSITQTLQGYSQTLQGYSQQLQTFQQTLTGYGNQLAAFEQSSATPNRPGTVGYAFATSYSGAPGTVAPIVPGNVAGGPFGLAYFMPSSTLLTTGAAFWLEPNVAYVARFVFARSADDPDAVSYNTVQLGVAWLDGSYNFISETVFLSSRIKIALGTQQVSQRIPSLFNAYPGLTPPAGAVYFRPFIRDETVNGAIRCDGITVVDITEAGAYAPDVDLLAERVTSLESLIYPNATLGTLPARVSRSVANLPPPGVPGRTMWAKDGRAMSFAGAMENSPGSGVAVDDNGTNWVISGTNIPVQS